MFLKIAITVTIFTMLFYLIPGCSPDPSVEEELAIFFEMPGCNVGEYTGQLEDGVPHGEGTWFNPQSGRYEGSWFEGQFHGKGVFTWPDGKIYEGQWQNGYKHGEGVLYNPDRTKLEGSWRGGHFLGD